MFAIEPSYQSDRRKCVPESPRGFQQNLPTVKVLSQVLPQVQINKRTRKLTLPRSKSRALGLLPMPELKNIRFARDTPHKLGHFNWGRKSHDHD
jgi:hypothetical protein